MAHNPTLEKSKRVRATLEVLLASSDFFEGCMKATRASWGFSGYSVELFPDGKWRVLWDNEIGNLYVSPGNIMGLPTLDDSLYQECVVNGEMSEEEFFLSVFQNDEEELKQEMLGRFDDAEALRVN